MNEKTLHDIEYLRQKANVSYEEAANLLDDNGGDVVRALMVLEAQDRLYQQQASGTIPPAAQEPEAMPESAPERHEAWQADAQEAAEKAKNWMQRAFRHRLVIEHKREDGTKETVVNLGMPLVVGAAIAAPYLAAASAVVTAISGCRVKVESDGEK